MEIYVEVGEHSPIILLLPLKFPQTSLGMDLNFCLVYKRIEVVQIQATPYCIVSPRSRVRILPKS